MNSNTVIFTGIVAAGIIVMMFGLAGAQSPGQSFISIDPVQDQNSGDLLILSGTTNLPIGTELLVMVIEEPEGPGDGSSGTGTGATTKVAGKEGGANRWSIPIDTSVLRPDTYRVDAVRIARDPDTGNFTLGNVSVTTRFTLTGEYLGPELPVFTGSVENAFISLNPVGERHAGDQFLVTGATSLPVGTDVIWQVIPGVSAHDSVNTGIFTSIMANSIVTRGNGGENRVSFAMDTASLQPGVYTITVSTVDGDLWDGDHTSGNITESMEFPLQ